MEPQAADLLDAAIATGLGILVGLEREHSEQAQGRETLGVRTFALFAICGWTCAFLSAGAPWVAPAGLIVVGALLATQYLRTAEHGPGITTEVAAVATFLVGMLERSQRLLAVALALMTTLLLISKPFVRRVVPKLRRVEITATLQLLIALAIVLPMLPSEARDPWRVLSPRKIGLFIILTAGISYVGYVASRLLGARRGAGVVGVVGGLASSTAVTAAMSQQARADETMRLPGQLAIFLANTIMFARVLVVAAVVNRLVVRWLALPLGAMGLVMSAGAVWKWLALRREGGGARPAGEEVPLANPLALLPALKWGLVFCAVLVVSAIAEENFGERGLLATAAAAGLADVDAITLAVSRHAQQGGLSQATAALAITIAVVANTCVKAGIALLNGGRRFGLHIAIVFAACISAGIAIAFWQ